MQRTSHRCPQCSQLLALSSDMWGLYYLCATCGWTCEDDEHLPDAQRRAESTPQPYLYAPRTDHNRPHRIR